MTDDEFLGLAYEQPDSIWDEVTEDHRTQDVPVFTALLHRTIKSKRGEYTEVMWVQGFPSAKMVTVTHLPIVVNGERVVPGVITSIPVGWRALASAEAFTAKCESIVGVRQRHGNWTRRPHTIQGS